MDYRNILIIGTGEICSNLIYTFTKMWFVDITMCSFEMYNESLGSRADLIIIGEKDIEAKRQVIEDWGGIVNIIDINIEGDIFNIIPYYIPKYLHGEKCKRNVINESFNKYRETKQSTDEISCSKELFNAMVLCSTGMIVIYVIQLFNGTPIQNSREVSFSI